ncbi:cadherin-15 [Pelobates cultripes]|uniref:Cadherin-15 n=1 Tax=Pelobates cultripes TaxID=61616 RepID=A0AAD1WVT1_PELCU|nr:cadherin-15 [Pelobates cultripes]
MEIRISLTMCFLVPLLCQVLTMVVQEVSEDGLVLYPWRRPALMDNRIQRVKRAWVIPVISVAENARNIPLLLVQIKSDKQHLGSVIYSIKGAGVDEEPKGIFTINKNTGAVYLNAVLDREKMERFKLRAFAVDSGGVTLEEPTDLEIVVIDQNDNPPIFSQKVFQGHVPEGAIPGTLVMTIKATDEDDPQTDNAELRYTIIQQDGPQMFSINQETGDIRTVQVGLDREVVESYNLTVQVADMMGLGLASTAKAVIIIDDINDNAPEFTQDEFFMEVPEHSSGLEIGRVSVTDKDLRGSPNWKVQFSITGGDPHGEFTIRTDPETNEGVLFIIKPLDHEAKEFHQLIVSAENQAPLRPSAPRTSRSQTLVTITVKDVNEPPFFHENPKIVRVNERTPPGTEITAFTAIDPDVKEVQEISYALVSDPADWLTLDAVSGWIHTRYTLDRKSQFLQGGWYTALITATDNATPPRSATGTLSVEVLEVNDHAPVLWQYSRELCNKPQQGNGVLISATDEDLPPQAHPFIFQLEPSFTELTLNWSISHVNSTHALLELLSEVQEGVYVLPLLVADSGEPPLAQLQLLNISVCRCDALGSCQGTAAALFNSGTGISLSAVLIILGSIALLLREYKNYIYIL